MTVAAPTIGKPLQPGVDTISSYNHTTAKFDLGYPLSDTKGNTYRYVKNTDASALVSGDVVRIEANDWDVDKATSGTPARFLGVAVGGIAVNSYGFVMTSGRFTVKAGGSWTDKDPLTIAAGALKTGTVGTHDIVGVAIEAATDTQTKAAQFFSRFAPVIQV